MVQSKILTDFKNLLHYFGDKKDKDSLLRLGLSMDKIILAEQIHGNKVAVLTDGKKRYLKQSDGIITDRQLTLGIRTADCLPVFFYDPQKKIIAAIHAGWKGLFSGIIKNAVSIMKKLGGDAAKIKVAVGPHIQICCYNVPEERIRKFKKYGNISNKQFLDLGKIALQQLQTAGILAENIDISKICTSCDLNFWSFRRDKQMVGRMINIIGFIKS